MELMIEDLMEQLVEMGGSDLHLSAGLPPYFRISGKLTPIGDEALTAEQCQRLIFSNGSYNVQLTHTCATLWLQAGVQRYKLLQLWPAPGLHHFLGNRLLRCVVFYQLLCTLLRSVLHTMP